MDVLQPTPKELALSTLKANQEHQYALANYAEKLTAELAELDKILPQADTEDGESDLECDFYIPDARPPVGLIRNFLNPESPFFEDATKRTRYLNLTVRHTMPAKEVEALKAAVNTELRRVEQLEGASSATTDFQMADKLDWFVIAEKVSDTSSIKRTAEECKIKWIGELNPAVTRGTWSSSELQSLQNILEDYPNQGNVNWVEIAKKLGTNRLPIDCMRQGLERPRHVWTPEADQKILDAVKQYGTSWSLVARYVAPDVSAAQCSNRYLRTLDPSLHRGTWSSEEDTRLTAAVLGYGKSWAEVASVVPGRTSEQCRDRWTNTLDPAKLSGKKDGWSEEENKTLIEAIKKVGNKWKMIGLQMGRSASQVRLHYDKLMPVAGPSTLEEDENETGTSGRSTPKPRTRKSQLQTSINTPAVDEQVKPRPRTLAKTRSAEAGTKRMGADSDETPAIDTSTVAEQARPRPKALAKNKSAETGTKRMAADSVEGPRKRARQQDSVVDPTPAENQQPATADTSAISPSSNAKKGRRRIPQISNLPRRRSARLRVGGDGSETQAAD
ncbi:hypothetical protein C8R44DRAFT_33702 [Mycena epipterygia]|nr:hypothetical protein C8R44DRAFT_33702 [Mycena epipterygia]